MKELPIRFAMCSHCILSICNFSYFPFGFESGVWFLIAPVPVHYLLVTLSDLPIQMPWKSLVV